MFILHRICVAMSCSTPISVSAPTTALWFEMWRVVLSCSSDTWSIYRYYALQWSLNGSLWLQSNIAELHCNFGLHTYRINLYFMEILVYIQPYNHTSNMVNHRVVFCWPSLPVLSINTVRANLRFCQDEFVVFLVIIKPDFFFQ